MESKDSIMAMFNHTFAHSGLVYDDERQQGDVRVLNE